MSFFTKCFSIGVSLLFGSIFFESFNTKAATGVTLYTLNTKISVPPGESIDYPIDVINNTAELQNVDISVTGIPAGWNYMLKSGGLVVSQVSILPGEKKSLSLKVDVPLQVNKGNYRFKVVAGELGSLSLVINVSKQGTFKTEFTSDQANMQGNAKSSFTFNAVLRNRTGDKQLYSLVANAPQGWEVVFKPNYKQATSVEVDPSGASNITIEIKPAENVTAGTYEIPVKATTNSTSADLSLQIVITGSYSMELTTPTGLLSTSMTAGETKRIELVVRNTGSTVLSNVTFGSSAPANWDVSFEPKKIESILAGSNAQVFAIVKADKKAIPGDYMANFDAKSQEVSSRVSIRVSVKTSLVWGWVGIFIIVIALGSVYYLFRKYGRR